MPVQPLDILVALKAIGLSPSLRNNDRQIASALLDHFNRKTEQCDPSLGRLAGLVGVSTRTVMRSLARIEAAGLFRRIRHGGHLNRNSYEPNWARFAAIGRDWQDRMMRDSRARAATNMSPATRQPCHLAGDSSVTQTCRKNLSKETSKSPPRKQLGGGLVARANPPGSGDAVRSAAERRWMTALHEAFGSMPVTYGEIISLIDAAMTDAATDAEIRRHGAGFDHIVTQLRLGNGT
jgi:DNA-binding IclR family transcriptional regulator